MAKAWKQNIPSADLHFYTRGLNQLKETGFNYWSKIYGYGYGGIISTRIPFRMHRWQDKHAIYMPPKRRKARDIFKAGVYNWQGTPYKYGSKAEDPGVKSKLYWWGIAEQGGFQYYQLFMYYTLSVLHKDEIPHWLRIYKFEYIGFGDWYFGKEEEMIITWLSTTVAKTGLTHDSAWHELDLSGDTSPNAKFIIANLELEATATPGELLEIKKNGSAPGHSPRGTALDSQNIHEFVICACDENQIIQYWLNTSDDNEASINILGYIE